MTCERCEMGYIWADYRTCPDCAGTGEIRWWDEGDVLCPRPFNISA